MSSSDRETYERDVNQAHQALRTTAFSAAWAAGAALPVEQAIGVALHRPRHERQGCMTEPRIGESRGVFVSVLLVLPPVHSGCLFGPFPHGLLFL